MSNRKVFFLIILIILSAPAFTDTGLAGMEMLITPQSVRADGMAGIADGLNGFIESIPYNPSFISLIDDLELAFSLAPMPNQVTYTQIGAAFPAGPGVLGIQVNFLNSSTILTTGESGESAGSFAVFDLGLGVTYALQFTDFFSAGLTLKGLYVNLGESYGLTGLVDAGFMFRFKLPYIGQPPVAPTFQESEAQFDKAKAAIDKNNETRLRVIAAEEFRAADELERVKKQLETNNERLSLEETRVIAKEEDLKKKIEKAKAEGKEPPANIVSKDKLNELKAKSRELEAAVAAAEAVYIQAGDSVKEEKTANNIVYAKEIDKIIEEKQSRDKYIRHIENERERLFAVLNDPELELSKEIIDENITNITDRLLNFQDEKTAALKAGEVSYIDRRYELIDNVLIEIDGYKQKITDEMGDKVSNLENEIAELEQQISSLESQEGTQIKEDIKVLRREVNSKTKELKDLLKDPWIARLNKRIEIKKQEQADLELEIEKKKTETAESIEKLNQKIEENIQSLTEIQQELNDDLERAQLTRQINLLDTKSDKGIAKAQKDYRASELDVYERLLAELYDQEEEIIQSRLDAARENASIQKYELNIEIKKTRETLDDDFAFTKRFLEQKIKTLTKKIDKKNPDASIQAEIDTAKAELKEKKEIFDAAMIELNNKANNDAETIKQTENDAIKKIKDEETVIRLIYLQSDKPYKNFAINVSVRNAGLPLSLSTSENSYPTPISFYASLGYTFMNIEDHRLTLNTMFEYFIYEDPLLAVGLEYSFSDFAFVRFGYNILTSGRIFNAGFGLNLELGMAEYAIDYALIYKGSLYGFVHNFGITIKF